MKLYNNVCNVFVVVFQVLHPKNPFAPTLHFNYRYFETDAPKGTHSMLASQNGTCCVWNFSNISQCLCVCVNQLPGSITVCFPLVS